MSSYWPQFFDFYEFLLTNEGRDRYISYYLNDATNQFDSEYDPANYDFEKHQILVKYHDRDYDENDLGRIFSLDLYVMQQAKHNEVKTIECIDEEFQMLFSDEDCSVQMPLLLEYLFDLIERTRISHFTYKESLLESLGRILYHIRVTYRPSISSLLARIQNKPEHTSNTSTEDAGSLPKVTFQLGEIVKSECVNELYFALTQKGLIDRKTDKSNFKMVFTGIFSEKIIWKSHRYLLRHLIRELINIGFIEDKDRWKATINSFRLPKSDLTEDQLQRGSNPEDINRLKRVDSIIASLRGCIPSIPVASNPTSPKKN